MNAKHQHAATASAVIILALLFIAQPGAHAEGYDWPQFRGMHRDGVSPETGLNFAWADSGPKEVWRRPLGDGYSAISVVGDRLYTMYAADHEGAPTEFAAAFDAATGDELWRVALGARKDTEFGNGPSSTPSVDGDTVYVLASEGEFAALATADGAVRWQMNLTEAFGSEVPTFGFSTSPLVDGDLLLVEGGGKEGKSYAGLDKKSGKVKWTLGETPAGYNSPLLVNMNGMKRYVYVVQGKLMCIDEKGKEIWSHEWPQGETHAMPIFVPPNKIYASGAEGVGAQLLSVKESGKKAEVAEVWKNNFMRNHFSSAILHENHIYGFDNATLKSVAVEDSKMAWGKRGLGKGSLIFAEGHLLVLSDRGKLLAVEATPDGYVEKSSVQALDGLCWTAPTLANGRLYLRNHEEMVAYDLTK